MKIEMLGEYTPSQVISVISTYCNVYSIDVIEVELPSIRSAIPGVKVHSVLQGIQRQWLELATGRCWTADEFTWLTVDASAWIDHTGVSCDNASAWEYWWACEWKRAAEEILGLRKIGDNS